jgi:hypothetical protein
MQVRKEGQYKSIISTALAIIRVSHILRGRIAEERVDLGWIAGTRDGWIVGWGIAATIAQGVERDDGMGNVRECATVLVWAKWDQQRRLVIHRYGFVRFVRFAVGLRWLALVAWLA